MYNTISAAQFSDFMTFFSKTTERLCLASSLRDGDEVSSIDEKLKSFAKYAIDDLEMAARLSGQMDIFCPVEAASMTAAYNESLALHEPDAVA